MYKRQGEYQALGKWLEEGNTDPEKNRTVKMVVKRLSRVSVQPLKTEEIIPALETLYGIFEAMSIVKKATTLSQYFTFAFGREYSFDDRKNFLNDIYPLH